MLKPSFKLYNHNLYFNVFVVKYVMYSYKSKWEDSMVQQEELVKIIEEEEVECF